MTPRGLEVAGASTLPEKDLQQSPQAGAAKSGAVSVDVLVAMLAALSPEERARLAALLATKAPDAAPGSPNAP